MEFLGRRDRQIKIRGFRIEPAEVESALEAISGVRDCVVTMVEHDDDKRLVAYVVPYPDITVDVAALRSASRESLPDYMCPNHVVLLDNLPMLPNGKIDVASLPGIDQAVSGHADHTQPETDTERTIATIWASLLGHTDIGVDESFFSLGGHSLLLTTMIARIRRQFDVELALTAVFMDPTIRRIAELVATSAPESADVDVEDLLEEIAPLDGPDR